MVAEIELLLFAVVVVFTAGTEAGIKVPTMVIVVALLTTAVALTTSVVAGTALPLTVCKTVVVWVVGAG